MIRQAELSKRSIVAHRGASASCPENTRSAFEAAVVGGADAIELDVQVTADQQLVICHNPALDHYGFPDVEVGSSTLADLQALDIGHRFGRRFAGERLMTLAELLDEFGSRIPLYVEFKTKHMSARQVETLITGFLELTSGRHESMDLYGLCFDQGVLCDLAATADWLPLVWNTNEPHQVKAGDLSEQPWLSAVGCRIGNLNRRAAEMIHGAGLQLWCFTCNKEADVIKARDLGAAAIIGDDPADVRRILQSYPAGERRSSTDSVGGRQQSHSGSAAQQSADGS